jgi:hypothetical protein
LEARDCHVAHANEGSNQHSGEKDSRESSDGSNHSSSEHWNDSSRMPNCFVTNEHSLTVPDIACMTKRKTVSV